MEETKDAAVHTVRGRQYAVVSGHALATESALKMLKADGNIVDAAITAAATLCSAVPHACGLGGDCFILLHQDGETYSLNGSGPAPKKLPLNLSRAELSDGPLSCSVPGMVGAWAELHQQFGSRPWASLFEPAIDLAENGVTLASDLINAFKAHQSRLQADPGCQQVFLSSLSDNGKVLYQPQLAQTLRQLAAEGRSAFYEGEIGQQVCEAVQARGGVLSPADLAAYSPLWMQPLQLEYRGHVVCVPPPNSYAMLMLLQLAALAPQDFGQIAWEDADRLCLLMTAARQATAAAVPYLHDPFIAAELKANTEGDAPNTAVPAQLLQQLQSVAQDSQKANEAFRQLPRSNGTALVAITDERGNGISIIQSIFTPFGSHVADSKTGVLLNNRLMGFSSKPSDPNFARPGQRPAHTLSPALVLKDGRLRFLLTTPGGSGQTITLVQVLSNMVDYGLSLPEAIARPRWSLDLDGNLLLEAGIPTEVVAALQQAQLDVLVAKPEHRFFFGSAECISVDPDGLMTAVADYRRNAFAGGF